MQIVFYTTLELWDLWEESQSVLPVHTTHGFACGSGRRHRNCQRGKHCVVFASSLGFTRNNPWQTALRSRWPHFSHTPSCRGSPPNEASSTGRQSLLPRLTQPEGVSFLRLAGLCSQDLWSPRRPVLPLAPQQPQSWSTLHPPGGISRGG